MRNTESFSLPIRQRRPRQSQNRVSEEDDDDTPRRDALRRRTLKRALTALIPLFTLAAIFHKVFSSQTKIDMPEPDDEAAVTLFRIYASSIQHASETPPTCMPTVTRDNGKVEYVSNAVKSWYLAHDGQTSAPPPLYIYDMDTKEQSKEWRSRIGGLDPNWLKIVRLNLAAVTPKRFTLNDSATRVKWRSKEARDYSAVLRDCARIARQISTTTEDTIMLLVQDDVLFKREFSKSRQWAVDSLSDEGRSRVNSAGREVPIRTCSASLFDLGDGVGNEAQSISNLVARYWRVGDAELFASYIDRHFEDAPVDWLADRWCRRRRSIVPVLRPNPVRHRGRISSFVENKRDELLT